MAATTRKCSLIFLRNTDGWHWRLQSSNGKVLARSHVPRSSKRNAVVSANTARAALLEGEFNIYVQP